MLKFLDYGTPNPFSATIGKPRNLAWPVHVYRITLPKVSYAKDGLNAFERVILKMLDAVGVWNAETLAAETCIPLDLVKSILLRLQDKGLIDEYNNTIQQRHKEDSAPVFVTALLFRELATGKILPFLHWLDDANPLKKKEDEEDKKTYQKISEKQIRKMPPPTPRDVINAFSAMKKRALAFGDDGNKMPAVQQITIADSPELYYLDCPIAVQKCDGEFRIADPFGNGFSLILEKSFEQIPEQEEWLLQWKSSLGTVKQGVDVKSKENFETDANWQRYPKLIANLKPAKGEQFRTIAKIYASMEWALFYVCCVRPFKDVVSILKYTDLSQHAALLEQSARAIGLEQPLQGFRPVREGKLREFESGGAYGETVLAIAILQARDDEAHPLQRLAAIYPSFINRLIAINIKRNEKAHGKGSVDVPRQELIDDSFMREVVHVLVPDVVFTGGTPNLAKDEDRLGDELLGARANIQTSFGFELFNRLGMNLQDRLIHAERFFLSHHDGDNALGYLLDLYAAVQASFEKFLVGKLPPDASDKQLISSAESNAIKVGLCEAFPESLRTVKTLAVRQTLQGSSQSLGACVIALLLVVNRDSLAAICNTQPRFLCDMDSLIVLRGHGNEPLYLSKDEIVLLRKVALSTVKTLLEQ